MLVIDLAVENVEEVATNNWGEDDRSPVLAHSHDPESFNQKTGEETIQDSVSKSGKSRDESKIMRILNLQRAELCSRER